MKVTNDTLVLNDENGEKVNITITDYQKKIIKELELKTKTVQDSDGNDRELTADTAVKHIVKVLIKELPVDESVSGAFPEAVERITEDFKVHVENTTEAKETAEEKKAKKEAEKAAKEAEEKAKAEALKATQAEVAVVMDAGYKQADSEFVEELTSMKESLPDGVKIVNQGGGYGFQIEEGVTKETIGQTLGYMIGRARNNEALQHQIQFWIGDLVLWFVKKGIYLTAKDAGKAVSALIGENDKNYSESALDYYKKMAERTPIELRNPHVQPTAYLAIANMKLPTRGKDAAGKEETEAQFNERKAKFEKERLELQKKLASGEIKARKDVLEPVQNILVSCGLKKKEDPSESLNVTALAKQFFHAVTGLENFLGSHKEGVAIYTDGKKNYDLTQERLEELRDDAFSKLAGLFYSDKKSGLTLRDFSRGFVMSKKKAAKAAGKDGAKIEEEEVKVPVYPEVFWDVEAEAKALEEAKAEQEAEAQGEAPAETQAPAEAAPKSKKK